MCKPMFNSLRKKANDLKMKMLQKVAMKKLEKMSPEEREALAHKMMGEMSKPENRSKMLQAMEQMKASGQITEEQYRIAKQRMGL